MKTLEEHIEIYHKQNGHAKLTGPQLRRLFQKYRCRKCGAFGDQPCVTASGIPRSGVAGHHKARPA